MVGAHPLPPVTQPLHPAHRQRRKEVRKENVAKSSAPTTELHVAYVAPAPPHLPRIQYPIVTPTTQHPTRRRRRPSVPTSLFFKYNTALGPPYHILLDTNFINFAIKNKLEIVRAGMDCLLAKVIPCITDCVMAELEKLGPKYRIALRYVLNTHTLLARPSPTPPHSYSPTHTHCCSIAKDPRFERITCEHKGTYADDCLVNRVTEHRCYVVATCDKDLKARLRKIPGVPIMYISSHKFTIERMPEAFGAPR